MRQDKQASYPQGFKANPGLELANAFGVKFNPHQYLALALGKLTLLVLLVLSAALPVLSPPVASAAATPKKVLIFYGTDPNLPAAVLGTRIIRESLEKGWPARVQFYNEAMDSYRIPDDKYEKEMIKYLQRKYEGENIDLIFMAGSRALKFFLKHKGDLFPGIPKIFTVTSDHESAGLDLGQDITGVQGRIELKPALDLALSLHPDTRRVVVITGNSAQDKLWETYAHKEFRSEENGVEFTYLTNATVEELRKEVASLPPKTIVFFLVYFADRLGNGYSLTEAVSLVAPSSSAPIYVVAETGLVPGVVGGSMIGFAGNSKRAAQLGLRILAGEKPQDIPPETNPNVAIFDWRELRRWGIDEKKLPVGSIVRFREPTFWEQYKWRVVGVVSLLILQALFIAALLINLSRRRQAEKDNERLARLAEAEHQRLDEVISNVPGIVWEARSASGTNLQLVSFVSEHVEKMLGYSVHEWLSTPGFAMSIVADEDRERATRESQAILESGKGGILQFRWVTKGGRVLWVESQVAVINDEEGKPVGLRGVTMDVTDRKRAELEASQQRSELAHLSRVTMLGELSGSLAHELNQPLMAILSNAQAAQRFLAHDEVDLDELRDILTDIVDQDKRAGEVIHRLRLLLKKGEVEQQPLDVNGAVQEVLKLIRGDLLNHSVTTLTKLGPALPTVKGDRVQLQQVLLNLVMNACDAMNGNAPADRQIVVSTELSEGAGVRFSVSDRGLGLPAGELEQVFEPFFTSKPHGLGLGLSVCRSIVTAHGGKLWAANNPERGATFHFTLPVHNGSSL